MDHEPLKGWNHTPNVPLQVSPFFRWPLRPTDMLAWVWNSWFLITEKLTIAGIAFVSFYWLQPPLEETKTLAFGWIAEMYIRNLVLMIAVAGGLHLYFYNFTKQGNELRYDPRPLMKNGRQFTLGGQIKDNMFWALANGYAPMLTWATNPVWFVAMFLLIPIWESFYFYWIHRFLHIPYFYKHIHALHHRNINVGPWSGLSMHPVEHVIFLGSVLIHWIVAAHPVHILFHLQYYTLTAATNTPALKGWLLRTKTGWRWARSITRCTTVILNVTTARLKFRGTSSLVRFTMARLPQT